MHMRTIITNVKKYEFGESYEVKCYERGFWQHDKFVESLEEAIERMNFLISEYDFKEDEVQVCKLTYYANIAEEAPF